LKPNIADGKNIGVPKHHDAKDGSRPRTDAFDAGKGLLPRYAALDLIENVFRSLNDEGAALRSALRQTELAQSSDVKRRRP
jgi:hypothetical protein